MGYYWLIEETNFAQFDGINNKQFEYKVVVKTYLFEWIYTKEQSFLVISNSTLNECINIKKSIIELKKTYNFN